MSETVQKVLAGLILFLLVGAITNGFALWRTVDQLNSKFDAWDATTWPLERRLLVTDHVQLEARIEVNAANIEELENELEDIQ